MKTTEEAAEMVLRAAGSSLKNYTMPATREAILKAVTEVQDDAYRASIESINGFIQQNKKLRSVLAALVKAVETQDEDSLFELKAAHEILGLTSVIRPTERKVPEVQSCDMPDADWLRYMADKFVRDEPICERLLFIADKYEQMVFANIPKFLHPKTQRKVPEVVEKLRTNWAKQPPKDPYEKLQEVCDILADHFEKG